MPTTIEWCHETWNFLRGCSRDNAECDRCFAMHITHRNLLAIDAGLTKLRPKGSARPGVDWTGKIAVMPERLALPFAWKKPRKVFVNSMSDLFHHNIPFKVIAAAFGVMAATPRHTYQVLTKRPQRAAEFFAWAEATGSKHDLLTDGLPPALLASAWETCTLEDERIAERTEFTTPTASVFGRAWPLPNVHLGVSAGRQETAEKKVPVLLQLPAAVRWVSAEPLLGPVDFDAWLRCESCGYTKRDKGEQMDHHLCSRPTPTLDWIVVGGESGSKPRACDFGWIRDIVKQCREAGVPAFVKQAGGFPTDIEHGELLVRLHDTKGGDPSEWPKDLRVREWPATP